MNSRFAVLDWQETPVGVISLRRRLEPTLGVDVYEVKLDDEFLMSSLFTVAEEELARLGIAASSGDQLDVVVGGLGLGYTAQVALEQPGVAKLVVVEALGEVIGWHENLLLPTAEALTSDARTQLVQGDFFEMAAGDGFDPERPGRRFDAILLDVDHSPRHVLADSHAPFYTVDGLRQLARHLSPGGVFGLWSDDPPDEEFRGTLAAVFAQVDAHVVEFPNALTGGVAANTVYVAR